MKPFKGLSKPAEMRFRQDVGEAKPADKGTFQVALHYDVEDRYIPTCETHPIIELLYKQLAQAVSLHISIISILD